MHVYVYSYTWVACINKTEVKVRRGSECVRAFVYHVCVCVCVYAYGYSHACVIHRFSCMKTGVHSSSILYSQMIFRSHDIMIVEL